MDDQLRAFFAIEIPDSNTLTKVIEYQTKLQQAIGPLKLVDRTLMHITTRFLGNISLSEAEHLYHYLQENVNAVYFPNGKTRIGSFVGVGDFRRSVFFAKIAEVNDLLVQIHHKLNTEVSKFSHIQKERGSFHPHLTLARMKRNRKGGFNPQVAVNPGQPTYAELKTQYQEFDFGSWTISKVVLKKSTLTPQGPIYSNLTF